MRLPILHMLGSVLHAGLVGLAKMTPLQPGHPTVGSHLEATKHIRNTDEEFFYMYLNMLEVKLSPTKCVRTFIFVFNFSARLNI